jgi:serine/threonine protein kinase|tara:strand:- start:885 stop:3194 length:2310 start_codon:yes stop_codon:yes gene_type:complete
MTLQLEEGQSFADRFTLFHKLQEAQSHEIWVALDAKTNERVSLKFLVNRLDQVQYDKTKDDIARTRALIHPNIVRTYDLLSSSEGHQFIVSQYSHDAAAPARGTTSLQLQSGSHRYQLELLSGVLDALEYAHSLNLAHGNLNPSNILIDASGNAHLTDFGIASLEPGEHSFYHSPQVKAGLVPASKDDIYSLGALLYELFGGVKWDGSSNAMQTDFPLPKQVQSLVLTMLRDAPYKRPASIKEIRPILDDYLDIENNIISSSPAFSKPTENAGIAVPEAPVYTPLSTRESRVMPAHIAVPALFLLLIGTASVFVYLPDSVEPLQVSDMVFDQTAPDVTDEPIDATDDVQDTTPAPFQQAQLEQLKEDGKTLAAQLLRQQLYLEDQGVQLWAPDLIAEVQTKAEEGDKFFREESYSDAVSSFQTAMQILDSLSASVEDVKADSLQSGLDALNDSDSKAALGAFEIVLSIEPTNGAAQQGIDRANTLDEVLLMMKAAAAHEGSADLESALSEFRKASSLDPKWAPAAEGHVRVRDKIRKRDFNHAMSLGFAALEKEGYDEARDAFNQAQTILPASAEPADALQQIHLAIRLKQIAEHRGKAIAFRDNEQWQKTADEYAAVLALDPSLLFASEGQSFARGRAALAGRLDRYIGNPVLLNDNNGYESARQAVTNAQAITQPGPRLRQQISSLTNLIKLARTPLQVELRSDKLTDVTVYRVGRLGRLESTQLTLNPGTYRVVGKRRGYRDVQHEFTLIAGQQAPAIFVSCTERI